MSHSEKATKFETIFHMICENCFKFCCLLRKAELYVILQFCQPLCFKSFVQSWSLKNLSVGFFNWWNADQLEFWIIQQKISNTNNLTICFLTIFGHERRISWVFCKSPNLKLNVIISCFIKRPIKTFQKAPIKYKVQILPQATHWNEMISESVFLV